MIAQTREFSWRHYNCGHYTREVWMTLTGVDLGLRMPERITREDLVRAFTKGEGDLVGTILEEIPEPEDPCLVLLGKGPLNVPHCGVYHAGALLHLPKNDRVQHQQLHSVMTEGGFTSIRYFRNKPP